MKVIRDPIHQYIEIEDHEVECIDTPLVQRLRHIAQNGPTRLVYPSLIGTRFEHSLGVLHIATKTFDAIWEHSCLDTKKEFIEKAKSELERCLGIEVKEAKEIQNILREILRIAALFHDIGHLPLSHNLEPVFDKVFFRFSMLIVASINGLA